MNFYSDYVEGGKVYTNYEDLKKNFKIKVPENFNFSYDIIDRYEEKEPTKRALVWCDDTGDERIFTFADIARESRRTANYLVSKGIKKGDAVMLILRRRYEFWFFITALHRIGAIAVPATNQLLQKDLEYRTNAAQIKMIVSYDDTIQEEIEKALPASPSVKALVTVQSDRKGWLSYSKEISSFGTE
ncbi:MAG: AMP-binding protein, partial [Treponema sp.]|nr:AMP-binding protein [Treponema sp.]